MDMNKKYAEGFDYDKIKKSAKASSKTDELANSEDELDILEVEEDEFE